MKKCYEFPRSPGSGHRIFRALTATAVLLLMSAGVLHAGPSEQQPPRNRIDISVENATLEQVLLHVQNISGYYVLFNSTESKGITGLNIDLNGATVEEVLRTALRNTDLDYAIEDDTIVVKARSRQAAVAQTTSVTVNGTVKQASDGAPLVGANVTLAGTTIGTSTDADGRFTLTFTNRHGAILTVSYLGMGTQQIPYTGQTQIDVTMVEIASQIDDVIVTGFADININKTAGNITSVRGEDLARIAPTSVLSAISAFEPSFRFKENLASGANPNVLPEFTIRGETALNPDLTEDISRQSLLANRNLPIFLVDGFEVDVERIYDMDPNRIAKLTVLKDASATALYGSRAANGIVVIETKAPQQGRVNVDYNVTTTLHTPDLSSYDLMNAREKVAAEFAAGYYPLDNFSQYQQYRRKLSYVANGVETDWLAQGVRNVVNHRHDLNITGGNDDVRWGGNANYNSGNGVMKGSERSTYSAEFSLQIKMGNFRFTNQARYGGQKGSESPFGSFASYSHKQPYDMLYDQTTGELVQVVDSWGQNVVASNFLNPVYEAENFNSYNRNKYDQYSDVMMLRWDISPRFHVTGSFSIDKKYSENRRFIDPNSSLYESSITVSQTRPDERGRLTLTESQLFTTEGRLQLSYNNQIDKHFFASNINGSIRQNKASQTTSEYVGFTTGSVSTVNAAAKIVSKPSNRNQISRAVGFNFYGNYVYNDIYMVDLAFALDANAEFGSKNKTAPFWSVAGGIQFHNYDFFRSEKIDRLVLRGSYGLLGRVPMTQSATRNIYQNISQDDWYITGVGSVLAAMANQNLRWEQTWLTDVSAEIQMWQNRFFFKVGYYNKITDGQLTEVGIPSSSGFTYYWDNMGKVKNEGVEVDFHVEPVRNADWSVRVGAKLRHNKNVIMELSEAVKAYNSLVDDFYAGYDAIANPATSFSMRDMSFGEPYRKFYEGASTTSIPAMRSLGINPGNGQEVYMRPDGTITYQWRSMDQIVAGDTEPDVSGSVNLSMRWRQFDMLASFYLEFGAQAYNTTLMRYVENVNLMMNNADKRVNLLRWKNPGDVTPLKSIADRDLVTRPTTRFVQDRNIFRSVSLDVGYTLDRNLVQRLGLSNARLSFNTGEMFYLSNVKRERGTDYPFERTYSFKVQLSF